MLPVLVRLECFDHEVTIKAYATGLVVATAVFVLLGWAIAVRRGLPRRPALVSLLAVALAAWVGARLGFWCFHSADSATHPSAAASTLFVDFSFTGAFLLAAATGLLACALTRIDPWSLGDAAAPGIGLGLTVARLGCFLNGCCFGKETALPWGVTFPAGSPAYLHQLGTRPDVLFHGTYPVHPTQLYEMAAGLAAAAVAAWLLGRRAPNGVPMFSSVILLVGARWLTTSLRPPLSPPVSPSWLVPVGYAGLLLAGAAVLAWRLARSRPSGMNT